jgi:hypothetical protein
MRVRKPDSRRAVRTFDRIERMLGGAPLAEVGEVLTFLCAAFTRQAARGIHNPLSPHTQKDILAILIASVEQKVANEEALDSEAPRRIQ